MTSIIRSAVTAGAAFVLVAGLATGATGLVPQASAATTPAAEPTAVGTPSAADPAVTSAPTTAAPSSSVTATPTANSSPATGPAATPATDAAADDAAADEAPTDPTTDTGATDPSLDAQDAAGNHAMGSTIPASDPASLPARSKLKALAQTQATAAATKVWPTGVKGLDVSAYQPTVDWAGLWSQGSKFAYIKATEGTTYQSSKFAAQYAGAYNVGMIRGAYHFATPNTSSGAAQAAYFVAHGGNWSADGRTLPPLLDIEYGYDSTCWGLSQAAMVSWIADFSKTVLALTGVRPAIYSTTNWWITCTGNSKSFSLNPLFVAQYPTTTTAASQPASIGASWSHWSFWQWSSTGPFPGDSDVFNGSLSALTLLAKGGGVPAPTAGASLSATLLAGKTLASGASIYSSNRQYRLQMRTDGALTLYGNGRTLWYTSTAGNPGARVTMQTDGNLVVYSKANTALWSSRTNGIGANAKFIVQSTGDLQIQNVSSVLKWRSGAAGSSSISSPSYLGSGHFIHDSTGLVQAIMGADGNFVVYISGRSKFATNTAGNPGAYLSLQANGDLLVRAKNGVALWHSRTSTIGSGSYLVIQDDGNLVVRAKNGKTAWNSRTHV